MASNTSVYPLTMGIAALRDVEGAYDWEIIMAGAHHHRLCVVS